MMSPITIMMEGIYNCICYRSEMEKKEYQYLKKREN